MSVVRREQKIEFTCIGLCAEDDATTWMVDGHFLADGTFMPDSFDECGSDADCPECGEQGEPIDSDITLADW